MPRIALVPEKFRNLIPDGFKVYSNATFFFSQPDLDKLFDPCVAESDSRASHMGLVYAPARVALPHYSTTAVCMSLRERLGSSFPTILIVDPINSNSWSQKVQTRQSPTSSWSHCREVDKFTGISEGVRELVEKTRYVVDKIVACPNDVALVELANDIIKSNGYVPPGKDERRAYYEL